ncbi:hypothetical protein B0H12DRAFT_1070029 [Mycena haematopus]|nr:hypothetical protein B0H12DRAFT_1070029 [Mycena haematopus]
MQANGSEGRETSEEELSDSKLEDDGGNVTLSDCDPWRRSARTEVTERFLGPSRISTSVSWGPAGRAPLGDGFRVQFLRNMLKKFCTTLPSGKSSDGGHDSETIPRKEPQPMTIINTHMAASVLELAPEGVERIIPKYKPQPNIISAETARTASNALELALRTLSIVFSSIPVAGALSGIVNSLLVIMGRIKQTTANTRGLTQLAARIERLTPIVAQMARDDPDQGQTFVRNLQQKLPNLFATLSTDFVGRQQDQYAEQNTLDGRTSGGGGAFDLVVQYYYPVIHVIPFSAPSLLRSASSESSPILL